ncbi:MAG: asparagine synthase (glutamine-hydrolyzing), partial [Polaromonas sp.]|nr:asparagine synthase (glutamine-hydrolyzing) [Gemmatimonadaceae bacterium]
MPDRLKRSVDQARLTRMRDAIVHRGPDGAGMLIDGPIGLGHRRLSIVDVVHGAQPMTTDDGRSTIVYNGEVFNHPTLMATLQSEGVSYHTHCDTETVLHLYEKHGRDFVRHCRGMFAIAIWDRTDRSLTIARDRFGVKPIYYVHDADGTLYFASEIKALLAAGAVSATLDMASFPDFLANHAPSGNDTLFAGVKRLPPGHTMRWVDGVLTFEQYWDLSFTPDPVLAKASDADLVAEYSTRFEEAVRLRLMADVPLGMFLSGGIDSAAITAVMSEMVDGPIKTFSVAFAEREANELRYARLVSDRFRTEHHEIVVTPEQFWDALPQLIWHEDEPIAHPSSVAL